MKQLLTAAVFAALGASLVLAGPPLICHPFEIGQAESLPWGTGDGWNNPDPGYDLSRLVPETLALLSPRTPVIVRMEAMRRATIYASKKERMAADLLKKVRERTTGAGANDSLAWFDAGYLTETYRQFNDLTRRAIPEGQDGYAWTLKAIAMGGDVAAMEYAASLIKAYSSWPNEHLRKAQAAAKPGSLLSINLAKAQ